MLSEWSYVFTELISDNKYKRVQYPLGKKMSFPLFSFVWHKYYTTKFVKMKVSVSFFV